MDETLKPALLSAFSALACDMPVTGGTVPEPGPSETNSRTVEPSSACSPAPGFCVATWSLGTWALTTRWMSTSKPRFCNVWAATLERSPTTSGTAACLGASSV